MSSTCLQSDSYCLLLASCVIIVHKSQHTVKLHYSVFLGTKKWYVLTNREGKTPMYQMSQIPRCCTHERVTMNTVVQSIIKQCNQSCWLFPWLCVAGMQTGRRRLSWTTWVGGICPALAAVRSAISTPSWHRVACRRHQCSATCRHIIDWSQLRRRRANIRTSQRLFYCLGPKISL